MYGCSIIRASLGCETADAGRYPVLSVGNERTYRHDSSQRKILLITMWSRYAAAGQGWGRGVKGRTRRTGKDGRVRPTRPTAERGQSPAERGSPLGLHRVLEPAGVLPQAALRLDPDP